jgi:asparagine synthase (glutamine-hydrolysing)
MCGIAGYGGFFEEGLVARMTERLRHRGPDSGAIAEFCDARMALGIRRLAIIDLATGDQPMVSCDGRVHLVFNGEIYNYACLRREFVDAGYPFKSQSDTEVVLAAYLKWGAEAWRRLDGMFAAAIVDRRGDAPALVLARDRVGIKPLYVAESGGRIAFASEIKALVAWAGCATDINLGAIRDYLALRYVPGPRTLFTDIEKFPPGHMAVYQRGTTTTTQWWRPPVRARSAESTQPADAAEYFGSALRAAVRSHMVADVPVGAFLSGGIDSNAVVALMREATSAPLHTFSVGFAGVAADDPEGAALTATRLGTRHHHIECRSEDFAALPEIAWSLDEPVGDAIVVPMSVLSREARREVKVVLSGEGADEILGGYLFHRRLVQIASAQRVVPSAAWRAAAAVARRLPLALLRTGFDYPGELGELGREKISALLRAIGNHSLVQLYRRSISLFDDEELRLMAAPGFASQIGPMRAPVIDVGEAARMSPLQVLVAAQFSDWLPDDILMKADKMSMAHSLELRVPFMDERVIRAAIDLPDRSKVSLGANKKALRDFAEPMLPSSVTRARKRAFYVPLESYVGSGPLRDIFDATLDPVRLRRRGLFRPEAVRALAADVGSSGFLALKRQFAIVMLELWFDRFAPGASWA